MEISFKKTELMTNNTSGVNTKIKVNGQKLETVISFKYLGSVITDGEIKKASQRCILSHFKYFGEKINTNAALDTKHENSLPNKMSRKKKHTTGM